MLKRKGLSFDEKKATLLAAMQDESAFYTLKELENLGKSKGVIPQAVKDVVECLCADGDVQTDKVGTQVLFWSLPSQKLVALRAKKQKLTEDADKTKQERETLYAELAKLQAEPVPTEQESAELKARLASERKRRDELKSKVSALERFGPGKVGDMQRISRVAKEAANRWADNVCAIRSVFIRESRGEVKAGQFNNIFNLPDDFEILE